MEAGLFSLANEDDLFERCDAMEIPLLGVVAAGTPYQAFAVEETLSVPSSVWGGKQVFALRVRGSSMIDEGIHNGDYLIVEPRQTADTGQTVVAEIDGCVTVKRYHRDAQGQIRLQPANPEMLPLLVRAEDVRIIGVVVGVLRKFGFAERRSPAAPGKPAPHPLAAAAVPRRPGSVTDAASIDLVVNAIDSQLVRWNAAIAHAKRDRRLRQHVVQMAELGRDLQALRDWCARTHKPGLRRALIAEANKVMRRMQRFAAVTPAHLPDLVLH
jgi:repressor LexA